MRKHAKLTDESVHKIKVIALHTQIQQDVKTVRFGRNPAVTEKKVFVYCRSFYLYVDRFICMFFYLFYSVDNLYHIKTNSKQIQDKINLKQIQDKIKALRSCLKVELFILENIYFNPNLVQKDKITHLHPAEPIFLIQQEIVVFILLQRIRMLSIREHTYPLIPIERKRILLRLCCMHAMS